MPGGHRGGNVPLPCRLRCAEVNNYAVLWHQGERCFRFGTSEHSPWAHDMLAMGSALSAQAILLHALFAKVICGVFLAKYFHGLRVLEWLNAICPPFAKRG